MSNNLVMVVELTNSDSAFGTYGHIFNSYEEAIVYLRNNGGGTIEVCYEDVCDNLSSAQPAPIDSPTGTYFVIVENIEG